MSWSNGKQVKNSQTTRVNRSYTLRTHHRILLLRYASLWLWAVAVQASRHYNSQHYPELLCPAPQRHQSQNMTPTIAPYCKTSLRAEASAVHKTMCPWRGQGLADAHSSIPLLHWDLTIHISSLLCALSVHLWVYQTNPGGLCSLWELCLSGQRVVDL